MKRTGCDYNFTRIANEALERLSAAGLSGREFRIVFVVLRKTLGWGKVKDKIALSQFSKYTGLERRNCHAVIKELIKKKIIKKSVVANGDRKIITYLFNDVYSEWRVSLPMATREKKKVVVANDDRLSSPVTTKLSPPVTHTKENNINLLKESGEAPPGLSEGRGFSPPFDKGKILEPMSHAAIEARKQFLRGQAEQLRRERAQTHAGGLVNPLESKVS